MASLFKKRVSPEELTQSFEQTSPPTNAGLSSMDSDPVIDIFMIVDIREIDPYDRNPRKQENAEKENIKARIAAAGRLEDTLVVTRRSGDHKYMLAAGGNMRLYCTRELYDETGEVGFSKIKCLFTPFQSESALLLNHLGENENRGDLVLIDKALAVRDVNQREQLNSFKGAQRVKLNT